MLNKFSNYDCTKNLTSDEINNLLKDLKNCINPFSCPHGRPTFIKMSKYEIGTVHYQNAFTGYQNSSNKSDAVTLEINVFKLSRMPRYPLLLGLNNNSILYVCHIFFIHSYVNRHEVISTPWLLWLMLP